MKLVATTVTILPVSLGLAVFRRWFDPRHIQRFRDGVCWVREVLDAIITCDTCEPESFEYFEDWITTGHGKALVLIGLAVSMDPWRYRGGRGTSVTIARAPLVN